MRIQLMGEGDVAPAAAVLAAAHRVDVDFGPMLRRNQSLSPGYWWVLNGDHGVMGVVGATDYRTFAHIGLMAIDPDAQVVGAGSVLLQHCLDSLVAAGFASITLYSTDAGLAFYPRFGFRWAGLSTEWQLRKRREHVRGRHVSMTTDWDELAAWDRAVFGGERRGLIETLDREAPGRVLVARNEAGKMEGFAVAQPVVIGPFAASCREVAADLLDAALDLEFKATPRVLLPDAHADAEELMIGMGFSPARTSRYFVRGEALRQRRGWMYGQGAYSLG